MYQGRQPPVTQGQLRAYLGKPDIQCPFDRLAGVLKDLGIEDSSEEIDERFRKLEQAFKSAASQPIGPRQPPLWPNNAWIYDERRHFARPSPGLVASFAVEVFLFYDSEFTGGWRLRAPGHR
jgi:hypothetical protein